jgi:hypothetical protein
VLAGAEGPAAASPAPYIQKTGLALAGFTSACSPAALMFGESEVLGGPRAAAPAALAVIRREARRACS